MRKPIGEESYLQTDWLTNIKTRLHNYLSSLDINKKITKEEVKRAYIKIQKKIHPDISPETSRLSAIVNEAKETILKSLWKKKLLYFI